MQKPDSTAWNEAVGLAEQNAHNIALDDWRPVVEEALHAALRALGLNVHGFDGLARFHAMLRKEAESGSTAAVHAAATAYYRRLISKVDRDWARMLLTASDATLEQAELLVPQFIGLDHLRGGTPSGRFDAWSEVLTVLVGRGYETAVLPVVRLMISFTSPLTSVLGRNRAWLISVLHDFAHTAKRKAEVETTIEDLAQEAMASEAWDSLIDALLLQRDLVGRGFYPELQETIDRLIGTQLLADEELARRLALWSTWPEG